MCSLQTTWVRLHGMFHTRHLRQYIIALTLLFFVPRYSRFILFARMIKIHTIHYYEILTTVSALAVAWGQVPWVGQNERQKRNCWGSFLMSCLALNKLEILQSLGGLYDGLAFYPCTGLRRLQIRSLSLPTESPPPHWYTPTYTINDSWFHPLLFMSP